MLPGGGSAVAALGLAAAAGDAAGLETGEAAGADGLPAAAGLLAAGGLAAGFAGSVLAGAVVGCAA
jgi:hypothetical protein